LLLVFIFCYILICFHEKKKIWDFSVEQNFTAKFSCRIIVRARVHYLLRNFEVVKLTQVNTLHGPARRGVCELSNAILRRDRLWMARQPSYFQRNAIYVYKQVHTYAWNGIQLNKSFSQTALRYSGAHRR